MSNSRQKILNYINEQHTATAEELSKIFKVTSANIRHHLSILVEQGSLVVIGQKANPHRGRPTQIYASANENNQANLAELTEALLSILLPAGNMGDGKSTLDQLAGQLVEKYKLDDSNPTRRLYSSIHILNRMNYHAHWEAHVENPRIMFGHCPYQRVRSNYPQLCQVDTLMLGKLIGVPVEQVEQFELNEKGLPQCVFLLNHSYN